MRMGAGEQDGLGESESPAGSAARLASSHQVSSLVYVSVQMFRPGSTAPGARLWDARTLFEEGSARCDKALRQLGPDLPQAVTACIEAAGVLPHASNVFWSPRALPSALSLK